MTDEFPGLLAHHVEGCGLMMNAFILFQNAALFHEKKKRKDCFWKWWFISAATFGNNASCQSDMSTQGIKLFLFKHPLADKNLSNFSIK